MGKKEKKDKKKDKKKDNLNSSSAAGAETTSGLEVIREVIDETGRRTQMISNVRIIYASLHEFPIIDGKEQENGSCRIILNKEDARDMKILEDFKKISAKVKDEVYEPDVNIIDSKQFYRDGAQLAKPMPGYWIVSYNCPKATLPVVVDTDGKTIVTSRKDCRIYNGCRVNIKGTIWGNKKQVSMNQQFISVQFAGDDESFDPQHVSTSDAVSGFDQVEAGKEDLIG